MTAAGYVVRIRRPTRHATSPYRGGFTLLETLLALVLTAILMVSVVSGITLYAQYRHRGLEGARYAKILAGTLDDLRSDLRACYSLAISDTDLESGPGSQGLEQSDSFSDNVVQERVLSFTSSRERPIQFIGRENALLMVRQGTNARFGWSEFHPAVNLYQVLWLAPGLARVRLPYATEQQRPLDRGFQIPSELAPAPPALHRCSTPLNNQQLSREAVTEDRGTVGVSWDKNSEIKEVKFRYFDGLVWRKDWNSHLQQNRLPLAVELQMKLACAPEQAIRVVMGLPR